MQEKHLTSEFSLSVLRPGAHEKHVSFTDGNAEAWGIRAAMRLEGEELLLTLSGIGEAVVTLWLKPEAQDLFPLLPGFMIGRNNPEATGPYYPQLASRQDLNFPKLLAPSWGIRADRATMPAAFLFGENQCWALAVPPYIGQQPPPQPSPGVPGEGEKGPHTTNGLRVCLERGVGISIGFVVEPVQYVHQGVSAPGYRGYHTFDGEMTIRCRYFCGPSDGRKGHAAIVKRLYALHHEAPPKGDGVKATVRMVSDAIVHDVLIPAQTTLRDRMGGELFKIKDWKPARPVTEIGWTGGSMLAYPFLAMQTRYAKPELADYARQRLDRICASVNPASGFFWECQEKDKAHAKGWWTGLSPEAHYAYTQGHACYYLLRSARFDAQRQERWVTAAGKVLDRVIEFQQPNGQFPVAFSIADGRPTQTVGFAGCWFAAGLVELYAQTKEARHLDAAVRAIRSYHADVGKLEPFGTPMDTHNATDQEGNLALLHASAALHKLTGEAEMLEILRDSADFEMLWRYYYNTRPPHAPLDTADWGSSGGSVTSAHNPHIHKMHLNSLDQVLYLADQTREQYYVDRTRDAVRYACACVCRPSEDFGWGKPGWLCERFCPSDGLVIQHNLRTGEPWAAGCDYHPWNVGVLLEGLTGEAWDRFPDLL